MESRRLDYDYKKKRQGKIPDEEIQLAQEKFNESKELSGNSMASLLELDVSKFVLYSLRSVSYYGQFTDNSYPYGFCDFYHSKVGKQTQSLHASLDFDKKL